MRWTKTLIPTLKETPQEAEVKSHRLMLRAGLIRKLASGTYSYLPLGLRALAKAEAIVRQEMDRVGALEVLLPALHPAELWRETGRFDILGEDMLHFKDRHGRENVLGPTHEEVITDLARRELHSYKQLPVTLYQIQTKFRDEMRPRSGVIRSREFVMKDAYSFHENEASLDETYERMKEAYRRIFTRCGLDFHIVQADPGAMGGSGSQEFVLFTDAGEDWMVQTAGSDKVVSVEMAKRRLDGLPLPEGRAPRKYKEVATPNFSGADSVAAYLKKKPSDLVKMMIYEGSNPAAGGTRHLFAVLVRGDHEVSDFKLKAEVRTRMHIDRGANLASRDMIEQAGSSFGFSGPIGFNIPLYIDEDVLKMDEMIIGANKKDYHIVGATMLDVLEGKDRQNVWVGDYRQAVEGDPGLTFKTAIELGHIFKLNLRYSLPMKAQILDKSGKSKPMLMGCYGIGVNRILAAAVEQFADDKGIVWPRALSPYQVGIILIASDDPQSNQIAERLGSELEASGVDVLIDDRDDTAGVKFNDADLVGLPVRVILGPKNLKNGKAEIKLRGTGQMETVGLEQLAAETLKALDKISPRC